MGIPKFFRYISERYPLTSQLIQGDKIPEFDNFYLDFNGIIHNCSHPNDADAHFRMSEEQIFTSIFAYVDHLFSKIRPKKLFFMAVDGVAPRAKMNQQRSRRFRTAKEAGEVREKALRAGEKLPDEKAFDSNCITPGTPFMARLSEQLQYFVNKKITEDANWRDVKVVLSGHSVPGEGEHKIMEYIRLSRAQDDYNPNIRHCLYGLDADLMMLGLLSHDPHFCLLREEVKFGPASKKKSTPNLESQTFFLLHLSLLREYLDLEFKSVESILPFPYDLERIIDDFVLLAVFVGNDFLPHLPDFHIHDNALERLFDIYKNVLPRMGGYLNMNGTIDTSRLQTIMEELSLLEQETFEKENADMNWYHGKQAKHTHYEAGGRGQETGALSQAQSEIFKQVKTFIEKDDPTSTLPMANTFPARDREFIKKISSDLGLLLTWDEYNEDDENVVTFRLPVVEDAERDEESRFAIERVLNKYSKLDITAPDLDGYDLREKERFQKRVDQWKRAYYREKLELSFDNPEELDALVYRYVEGLQWVMYYYYSGVASWGWFYNYHFSPRISDLVGIAQFQFSFELGTPFRPFEQLMGVLPEASKEHIPEAYRDLMSDPNSPILDFYPAEFAQDMNGKKQEWEAVVKIPFIDESRLLRAMQMREHRLTPEERSRNGFGSSTMFTYNAGYSSTYPSSLPGFFPDLHHCTCEMVPFDLPTLDGLHLVPGLLDGVSLGAAALAGFPSLCTLPHRAELVHHSVNVFQTDSRNKSIVIYVTDIHKNKSTADIAREVVGKRTFIDWPFLREGLVVAVSDSLFRHEMTPSAQNGQARSTQVVANPHSPQAVNAWQRKAERIEETYSKRCGVIIGPVDIILHVVPLKGLKRVASGALVKDYESRDKEVDQPAQTSVQTVISEDPRFMERAPPPLREEFPEGSKVFFLGEHAYGVAAQVSETTETTLSVVLAFFPAETSENERFSDLASRQIENTYHVSYQVSQKLGISGLALAKITSSFMVILSDGQKVNLGLSIKFEAKGMKVINYSRKDGKAWEFSDQAVALLQEYKDKHPEVFKALDRRGDAMTLAHEMFPSEADRHVRDVKAWLKSRGAGDFEPVSLMCDQLKKDTIQEIEKLADSISEGRTPTKIKKAVVKGIPRQAVLKPAHSIYKLQNQHFALGDRVVMVQDTGSVPLGAKGVVVGLDSMSMEVVWDVAFMSGTTLGNRCSQYRGLAVGFDSCLNLTNPQYIMSKNTAGAGQPYQGPFKPQFGPRPAVRPRQTVDRSTSGVDPQSAPTQIMSNPNRVSGSRSTENPYNAVTAGAVQPREHSDNLRDTLKYGGRGSASSNGIRRGNQGVGMQQQQQRGRGRGMTVPLHQHNGRGGAGLTGPTPGPSRGHPDRGRPFPNRGLRGRGKVVVAQTE